MPLHAARKELHTKMTCIIRVYINVTGKGRGPVFVSMIFFIISARVYPLGTDAAV
jgi:hypothetical protein